MYLKRPKLEVLSWCAGILGAMIAALAYFYPPSPSEQKTEPQKAVSSSTIRQEGLSKLHTERVAIQPNLSDKRNTDLLEAVDLAKKIGSSFRRNEQLEMVVTQSLNRRELEIAMVAAISIDSSVLRDKALGPLVCWYRLLRGVGAAKEIATLVQSSTLRDQHLVELVREASVPSGNEGAGVCQGK